MGLGFTLSSLGAKLLERLRRSKAFTHTAANHSSPSSPEYDTLAQDLDYHDTLADLNDLACGLACHGQLDVAEAQLRELSKRTSRLFGYFDCDAICTVNNLATIYAQRGKLSKAAAMMQALLAMQRRVEWRETQDATLVFSTIENNLAAVLKYQARLAMLNDEDFDQILLMNHFPRCRTQATALMKEVVSARVKVYGVDHVYTISAQRYLQTLRPDDDTQPRNSHPSRGGMCSWISSSLSPEQRTCL